MKTKTLLTLLALAFASLTAHAQDSNLEIIPIKPVDYDICDVFWLMQQRNGEIVTDLRLARLGDDPNHDDPMLVGHLLYKLSPDSFLFTDSLFIADTTGLVYFFAKNPRGEGNIRTNIEPDGNGNTLLRISRFTDDDLNVVDGADTVVPLCEGEAFQYIYSDMVDCQGNIILKYYKMTSPDVFEGHVARYAPDGTLLYETLIPDNMNFINTMEVFKEAPLEYCQWRKGGGEHLNLFVLDSIFQLKNTYVINKIIFEDPQYFIQEYFQFSSSNSNSTFVIPDGDDVLVAAPYARQDSCGIVDYGIATARYELRTMRRKALVQLSDYQGMDSKAHCFGFEKMQDGTIYLLYREKGMPAKYWMTVVKMDSNLNIEWKRYCEAPEGATTVIPNSTFISTTLADSDGSNTGFAITGVSFDNATYIGGVFYGILTHDGIPASVGGGIEVRPYMSYPNPAQDQLHLQYSPDVQPKHVELYDLQGRLVRSQGNTFETVDLGQLPAGTYTLRVTMQDGQTFSDKVVKE